MYCPKCGRANLDGSSRCQHCGEEFIKKQNSGYQGRQPVDTGSASGLGVVMALFLGLIGLIIGILIYINDEYKRSAFIGAWVKTFIITILIALAIVGIVTCATGCLACSLL